jgi:hypothetical protein
MSGELRKFRVVRLEVVFEDAGGAVYVMIVTPAVVVKTPQYLQDTGYCNVFTLRASSYGADRWQGSIVHRKGYQVWYKASLAATSVSQAMSCVMAAFFRHTQPILKGYV